MHLDSVHRFNLKIKQLMSKTAIWEGVEPINFFSIYKTKQKLNERLAICFLVHSHSFTFKLIEEITASTGLVPT